MVQRNTYPDYQIQGFSLTVDTAIKVDGRWGYYFHLKAEDNIVFVGPGHDSRTFADEIDAHAAAVQDAKNMIELMLSQKPIDEWRKNGVGIIT